MPTAPPDPWLPALDLTEPDLQLGLLRQPIAVWVNSVRRHVGRVIGAHAGVLSGDDEIDQAHCPARLEAQSPRRRTCRSGGTSSTDQSVDGP